MWEKFKAVVFGSNPAPRLLGGLVVLGEAAKMTQEAVEGQPPTGFHDWLMIGLGVAAMMSKQWNRTHAKIPNPVAVPAPPSGDMMIPKPQLPS